MSIMIAKHWTMALLLLAGGVAEAQTTDSGVGFYLDQDFLIPDRNEDRDYTMGLALEFFEPDEKHPAYLFDFLHKELDGWFRNWDIDRGKTTQTRVVKSYLLGTTVYTPDDLGASQPIHTDRPYASIVYLSNKRVEARDKWAIGTDLQLGVLGLNLANQVQTWIHQRYRAAHGGDQPVDPQGWGNQISDGGEPTVRYRVSLSHRLAEQRGAFDWDLSGDTGFSLGYQTNASAGLSARLGRISSPFWTLPYDPVNRGDFIPSSAGDEIYVWSAYRARLVGYDALMQGQFRNSEVTVSSADIKRLVHEGGLGITAAWKPLAVTLSLNAKSSEMKGGGDRTHVWGGVYLNLRY